MLKTYLFDFDDTIISTKIYAEMYPLILELIKNKRKLTEREINQKARELGLKKNKFWRWDSGELCKRVGLLEDYYRILQEHIPVVPALHVHSITLFQQLKARKKKIGIVSNSMRRTIELYLQRYDLHRFVDFMFTSEDAGCNKDKVQYWKKLILELKLNPAECLVIGDHPLEDNTLPRKVGFKTFLLKSPADLQKVLLQQ